MISPGVSLVMAAYAVGTSAPGLIFGRSITGTSGGRMLETLIRLMLPMPAARRRRGGRSDELASASAETRAASASRQPTAVGERRERAKATLTEVADGRGAAPRREFGQLGGGRGGGETGAEQHFFLAMDENGPYSQ